MNTIEANLKKEGITTIKALDTLTVNSIAKKIATQLCAFLPDQKLDYNEIFIAISRLNMYIADMPNDMAVAKYYYKNSSIYLSDKVNLEQIDKCLLHECIHAIQTKKDTKGNVTTLGLCDFSTSKMPGMAINEAAVQLLAEECTQSKKDSVKYYGIELETISPDYYPLECSIVNQMAYIVGKQALYHSTIFGDDVFKNEFTQVTSKKCYYKIQKYLDIMINQEEKIAYLNNKLNEDNITNQKAFKISKQITQTKETIKNLFIYTQNLIISNYFDNYYCTIQTAKDIENLRNKLYQYKNYIGVTRRLYIL